MDPPQEAPQATAADTAEDLDSTLGENSSTYTESLRSSLLQSVLEHGRGYHKYRDGQYILPEDQREQERLDMQHEMFLRSFERKLYLAPIDHELHEVIDLGTGTGIWAIDFADQYPQSNVLGIDLSPIQPSFVPPNCKFEVDDFDTEWTFNKSFDFIHGRMLLCTTANFPKLFTQAFENLNPGGWMEMQDLCLPFLCDDDSMEGTAWQEWNVKYLEACRRFGLDPGWTARYKEWMIEAGFEDVQELVFKWPINPWPKDKALKELGSWNMINMLDGLDGFTVRLWTKALGMTVEEINLFLVQVRKDLRDKKIHSYWQVFVVYGRKPLPAKD